MRMCERERIGTDDTHFLLIVFSVLIRRDDLEIRESKIGDERRVGGI